MPKSIKLGQWSIFADRYYWLTTILIARSHLSKQYRNSFLGIIWSLLTPLSMAIVYAIIMPLIMHFRVENYKALRDVSVELTPIHVFIGPNDSGKTSILEAIAAQGRTVESALERLRRLIAEPTPVR